MANSITLHQYPIDTLTPVYNPLQYVASSTNSGQANFKFVIRITIGSNVVTLKQPPAPNGYLYLDIHRIVENFVTSDILYNDSGFALNSNSFAIYTIRIGEEYGSTPVNYIDTVDHYSEQQNVKAWNAIFDYTDWVNYNYLEWIIRKSAKRNFHTNAPQKVLNGTATKYFKIGYDQSAWLQFATDDNHAVDNIYFASYSNAGTLIDEKIVANPYASPSSTQRIFRVTAGTKYLASLGLSLAGADYYIAVTLNGTPPGLSAETSERIKYELDPLCTKYTVYRMHFKNKLGGFDGFNFYLKDTLTTKIERDSFEKLPGTTSGNSFLWNVRDFGKRNTNIKLTDSIKVESDWITNAEAVWLKELFTTPEVYLENNTTHKLSPIVITSASYETKKINPAEKLFNAVIDFEPAIQNTRQRY